MKWLLENVRGRIGFAIENPSYALNAMVRELTLADEKFLARLTGSSPHQIRTYLDEPINTPAFAAHLRSEKEHFRSLSVMSADLFAKKILNQYAGLADSAFLPIGKDPGWLVAQWLRPAWQVHLGDAREILPACLRNSARSRSSSTTVYTLTVT